MKMPRVLAPIVAVAVCFSITACGIPGKIADGLDDGDSFEDRAEALNAVYDQGRQARTGMEKVGVVVNEASCGSSWVNSGAKAAESDMITNRNGRYHDVNFQKLRELSFVNGCMDRPNSLPATVAPSLVPTPSQT